MDAATMGPRRGQRVSRRTMLSLTLTASGAALLAACAPQAPAPAPTSAPAKPAEAAKPTEAAKPAAPAATTAPAAPAAAAPAATTAPAAAAKPTEAPKPAAKPAETPKPGGTLRWGMVGDIVTTDAVLWSPAANETCGAVCDALVSYDDTLKPIPRLAETWELSADNTKIKLNLRKGVQFHSGREFTADDVEYNVMRVRDPKNGFAAVVAPGSNWWTSLEKPDKYTVILTSDKPRPGVYDWLNYLRIQDKDVRDGPDGNTKVGGTGPFKWVEWVPGDHINMVKNTNYWDKTYPYVDEYKITIFRDQQSMVAALEAGALDVAALAPVPDAARLKADPKYQIIETHDIGQFFYAQVNASQAPTDNKILRQAIGWAIDRQRFSEQIMKGFVGEPRNLPWADISPAYDAAKNKTYGYDLEKAKALLAQSGATNVEFDIAWALAGFSAEYGAMAQVIQADLAKIGIKTNLKPMDPPAFTQAGLGMKPPYNGMRLSAGAFAQLGEAASEFALSRTFGYASNASGFYDPKFESLVTTASTEPDAAKRKGLYGQINDFLLDAAYCHTISAYSNIMATGANVRGMRWEPSTAVALREMWLA
jgi:peptide/nickel transport system substrate-binding protein